MPLSIMVVSAPGCPPRYIQLSTPPIIEEVSILDLSAPLITPISLSSEAKIEFELTPTLAPSAPIDDFREAIIKLPSFGSGSVPPFI